MRCPQRERPLPQAKRAFHDQFDNVRISALPVIYEANEESRFTTRQCIKISILCIVLLAALIGSIVISNKSTLFYLFQFIGKCITSLYLGKYFSLQLDTIGPFSYVKQDHCLVSDIWVAT